MPEIVPLESEQRQFDAEENADLKIDKRLEVSDADTSTQVISPKIQLAAELPPPPRPPAPEAPVSTRGQGEAGRPTELGGGLSQGEPQMEELSLPEFKDRLNSIVGQAAKSLEHSQAAGIGIEEAHRERLENKKKNE